MAAVTVSAWYDLSFHAMAQLPSTTAVVSSLAGDDYDSWLSEQFEQLERAGAMLQRTSPQAAHAATALSGVDRPHLAQQLPLLWDDVSTFLDDARLPIEQVRWSDGDLSAGQRARILDLMQKSMGSAPLERLREHFAAQWQVCYATIWQRCVSDDSKAYASRFRELRAQAASVCPALARATIRLVQPLRRRGRIMGPRTAPMLCIGVAHNRLAVQECDPIFQACHELFVASIPQQLYDPQLSPPSLADLAFAQAEHAALVAAARRFHGHPLEPAWLEWLGRCQLATIDIDDQATQLRNGVGLHETFASTVAILGE